MESSTVKSTKGGSLASQKWDKRYVCMHRLRGKAGSNRRHRSGAVVCNAAIDSETLLIVGAAIAGIGAGIGVPIFYSMQADKSAQRENLQPCFVCAGTGVVECRFCYGSGEVESFMTDSSANRKEPCVNCEAKGYTTCTTCNSTGIQPRYLDRREFQDDD